jgi:hypothetical protein
MRGENMHGSAKYCSSGVAGYVCAARSFAFGALSLFLLLAALVWSPSRSQAEPWQPQKLLNGALTAAKPSLANYQGRIYAAWRGPGTDQRMFWSMLTDRGEFSEPQVGIGGGSRTGPAVAAFGDRLYAAWRGVNDDPQIYWSSFDGTTWSEQQLLIGARTATQPALAAFGDRLYLAFRGFPPRNQVMYWMSFDGASWGPRHHSVGGEDAVTMTQPALAGVSDRLYVVFRGGSGDQRQYLSSLTRFNWTPKELAPGITRDAPSLTAIGDTLVMAWRGPRGDPRQFWSVFDGTSWTDQQLGEGTTSTGSAIAAVGDLVYAVWKGVQTDPQVYWSVFNPRR